jgi:hypothetical protein
MVGPRGSFGLLVVIAALSAATSCGSSAPIQPTYPYRVPNGVVDTCPQGLHSLMKHPIQPIPGEKTYPTTDAALTAVEGGLTGPMTATEPPPKSGTWYAAGGSGPEADFEKVDAGRVTYTLGLAQADSDHTWFVVAASPC